MYSHGYPRRPGLLVAPVLTRCRLLGKDPRDGPKLW